MREIACLAFVLTLGCSSRALRDSRDAVDDSSRGAAGSSVGGEDGPRADLAPDTPPVLASAAAPCVENIECASARCAGGLCCDRDCDGLCARCDLPGRRGTCSPVDVGTRCQRGRCTDDLSGIVDGMFCDGAGTCRPGPLFVCSPYACDPATAACLLACRTDPDCLHGTLCDNGSCGSPRVPHQCVQNRECVSGHCAQSVCCQTTCDAPGKACNLAGSLGTCTSIPDAGPGD